MKWLLISWICSGIAMGCKDPVQHPQTYDTYQECLAAGYLKGIEYNNLLPSNFINQNQIYMKFSCRKVNET